MYCSGCGGAMAAKRYLNVPIEMRGGCGGAWLEEGRVQGVIEVGPEGLPADRVKQRRT